MAGFCGNTALVKGLLQLAVRAFAADFWLYKLYRCDGSTIPALPIVTDLFALDSICHNYHNQLA